MESRSNSPGAQGMKENLIGVFRLIAMVFVEEFFPRVIGVHHFLQFFAQLADLTII